MDQGQTAQLLNEQMLGAWDLYIRFFTVFLTVNVTALGVVATKTNPGAARSIIAVTFAAQNAIAVVTGIMMARYTTAACSQLAALSAEHLAGFQSLGWWGGIGNSIGNGVIGLTWVALMFIRTPARPRPEHADHEQTA